MRLLFALTFFAACNDHPGRNDRAVPIEPDPRYGEVIDIEFPIHGTNVVGTNGKGGVDWVAVWFDAGFDHKLRPVEESFEVYRIDPADDYRLEAIDPPELVSREFYLWAALQPDQALLTLYGDIPVVWAYDGDEWLFIDPPPGLVHFDTAYWLLDADRLFAVESGKIAVWDGGTWRSVPAPEGSTMGPLERDRFRTVRPGPCTIAWELATLAPSEEVCGGGAGAVVGYAVTGDVDAFHLNDGQTLHRFESGIWSTAQDPVESGTFLLTTTAPDQAVLQIDRGARLPELRGVTGTGASEVLFPSSDAVLTCECDRSSDPSCPCGSGGFVLDANLIATDAQSVDVVLMFDANGERRMHVRRFDLPVTAIPYSAEDVP